MPTKKLTIKQITSELKKHSTVLKREIEKMQDLYGELEDQLNRDEDALIYLQDCIDALEGLQ